MLDGVEREIVVGERVERDAEQSLADLRRLEALDAVDRLELVEVLVVILDSLEVPPLLIVGDEAGECG